MADDIQNNSVPPNNGNGWSTYQRLVLAEIERCGKHIEVLEEKYNNLNMKVAVMRAQALLLGAIAGFLVEGICYLLGK